MHYGVEGQVSLSYDGLTNNLPTPHPSSACLPFASLGMLFLNKGCVGRVKDDDAKRMITVVVFLNIILADALRHTAEHTTDGKYARVGKIEALWVRSTRTTP